MHWHWTEALSVFHQLPHAFGDLVHHEDKSLIQAGASGLVRKPPTLFSSTGSPSTIGIEKDIDPGVSRSEQNLGLLVRDYLQALPEYVPETEQAEALLRHWKKILTEQPERLAQAHLDALHSKTSLHFWKEHLNHLTTDFGVKSDHFPNAIDDWERSAGAFTPPPQTLGILKTKQWQDLVIRQRIHKLDLDNMSRNR